VWFDPEFDPTATGKAAAAKAAHANAQLIASLRPAEERGKTLDLSDELMMTHYQLEETFHGQLTAGDTEEMPAAFPGGGHGPLTDDEQLALLEFRQMWADAKFSHLDEHTDFIKMLIENPDIEKLLGEAVFDSLYREFRRRDARQLAFSTCAFKSPGNPTAAFPRSWPSGSAPIRPMMPFVIPWISTPTLAPPGPSSRTVQVFSRRSTKNGSPPARTE